MRNSSFRLIAGLICILSLVLVSTAPAGAQDPDESNEPGETGTLNVRTYVSAQVEQPSLIVTDFDDTETGGAVPSDRELQIYLNEDLSSEPFVTVATVDGEATIAEIPAGTHYLFDIETQRFFTLTISPDFTTAARVVIPDATAEPEVDVAAAEAEAAEAEEAVAEEAEPEPPPADEPLPEATDEEADSAAPEEAAQPEDVPEPPVEDVAETEAATGDDEVALAPEPAEDVADEAAAPEEVEEDDGQLTVTQLPATGFASVSDVSQRTANAATALFVALSLLSAAMAFTWRREPGT